MSESKELLKCVNQLELDIMRLQAQNNMMKLLLCGSLETFSKRLDLYAAQLKKIAERSEK